MRLQRTCMHQEADRTLRRAELARRLMAHGARTSTVHRFTALSRHQLATLRKRWRISASNRHRGPSPRCVITLLRSPRMRSEAAALAALWHAHRPYLAATHAGRSSPLDRGEDLSEIYDIFLQCVPDARVTFEQLVMLVDSLTTGDEIALSRCETCHGAWLVERFAPNQSRCDLCRAPGKQVETTKHKSRALRRGRKQPEALLRDSGSSAEM